jgi:hypothetical protein
MTAVTGNGRLSAHRGRHGRGHHTPVGHGRAWLFRLKVIGGAALFVAIGGVAYWRGRRRQIAGCLKRSSRQEILSSDNMRLVALLVVLLSAFAWAPAPLVAQRQPVLRQIKVPHSYYYREMYLPQLTSGPSSVTWSF